MKEALPTAAIMARVVSLHPCDSSTANAMGPNVLNTIHCEISQRFRFSSKFRHRTSPNQNK